MITLPLLDHDPGIRHAFFTRDGGVSGGFFESLNCGFGSGDAAEMVARNRAIAMERLGFSPDRLVTCYQVHSTTVVTVEKPWPRDAAPRADGLVTGSSGIVLGILAADCAPVLFEDAVARVIGAAHGGWRGALGGIVEATLDRMEALGAERARIRAGIANRPFDVRPAGLYRAPAGPRRDRDRRHRARRSRHGRRGQGFFQLSACLSARRAGLWPRALGNRASRLTCETFGRYAYLRL